MNKITTKPWSIWKLTGFRYVFVFFVLKTSLWSKIPFVNYFFHDLSYYPSFFIQNYLLNLHDTPRWEHPPTGSGDTLDDWMLLLSYVILSLLGTLVWSFLDRKRENYDQLSNVLSVGLRYYLAMVMFSYGSTKLFLNQMPYPSMAQFYTPLGEFTPMRFTWMYLGYSAPYEFIGGFFEVLGGILILHRKTTLLGLLVLLGVMGNVFMLNIFYGVPVKIFSFFLMFTILYLMLRYRERLIGSLFNRTFTATPLQPYFDKPWQKKLRIGLKVIFLLYMLSFNVFKEYSYYRKRTQSTPIPITGAYDVDSFKRNGKEVISPTDTTRWNRIVISPDRAFKNGDGNITAGTSNFHQVTFELDSMMNLTVTSKPDTVTIFKGFVEKRGDNELTWKGVSKTDTLELILRRNERAFTLDKRKFMWVMEQKDF